MMNKNYFPNNDRAQYFRHLCTSRMALTHFRGRFVLIFIEFGMPLKLFGLMKTCLNETYNGARMGK
jgi:hypothetical protein